MSKFLEKKLASNTLKMKFQRISFSFLTNLKRQILEMILKRLQVDLFSEHLSIAVNI